MIDTNIKPVENYNRVFASCRLKIITPLMDIYNATYQNLFVCTVHAHQYWYNYLIIIICYFYQFNRHHITLYRLSYQISLMWKLETFKKT